MVITAHHQTTSERLVALVDIRLLKGVCRQAIVAQDLLNLQTVPTPNILAQNIQKLKDRSGLLWRPVVWHAVVCRAIPTLRTNRGSRLSRLSACHDFFALAAGLLRSAAFCATRSKASLRR